MNSNMKEQVELENLLDANTDFDSRVVPRWKRKSLNENNKAPTTTSEEEHGGANVSPSLCLPSSEVNCRVLAFKNKPVKKPEHEQFNSAFERMTLTPTTRRPPRHIPSVATHVLDIPGMHNDYYLNLLSWSINNTLALALGQVVYLWNCSTGSVEELMSLPEDCEDTITSVSWMEEGGNHVAIGTTQNTVQLWDATRKAQLRTMGGHTGRIGSLAWNGCMLATGSRDASVMKHDVRVQHHQVATMRGHSQEVCGLTWSPDGCTLASGSNDNTICLWDRAKSGSGRPSGRASAQGGTKPRLKLGGHTSAAKALAWSPHERNILASGGGSGDGSIKFWNTAATSTKGALMNSIETGSQVSSLVWNPNQCELLSGHGYTKNQLSLWSYPTMARIAELKGHTARVLHVAVGPDDSGIVASAGADDTLRFWNVFGGKEEEGGGRRGGRGGGAGSSTAGLSARHQYR